MRFPQVEYSLCTTDCSSISLTAIAALDAKSESDLIQILSTYGILASLFVKIYNVKITDQLSFSLTHLRLSVTTTVVVFTHSSAVMRAASSVHLIADGRIDRQGRFAPLSHPKQNIYINSSYFYRWHACSYSDLEPILKGISDDRE